MVRRVVLEDFRRAACGELARRISKQAGDKLEDILGALLALFSLDGFLWLVVPPSLASATLFDLVLEGGLLSLLKRTGLDLPRIHMTEALAGGLFLGTALVVTAAFLADAGVSPIAALAAGLISTFVRYYLGLWLGDRLGGKDDAELFGE